MADHLLGGMGNAAILTIDFKAFDGSFRWLMKAAHRKSYQAHSITPPRPAKKMDSGAPLCSKRGICGQMSFHATGMLSPYAIRDNIS